MINLDKLKYFLVKSPLGKYIRITQNVFLVLKIKKTKENKDGVKTVYCISPFKTGTTFLTGEFNSEVSKHEPIHFTTYKLLDGNFNKYFAKRMSYLNLKLECSGFWSAYIDQLAKNKVARDLEYVCILRSPSSWITSVINYWNKPSMLEFNFDIALEIFWKDKVGVDLCAFDFHSNTLENQQIIDKLVKFYFNFTKNTKKLNKITYIKLKEVEKKISVVESLIDEKASVGNSWKRSNKSKKWVYKNEKIDKKYWQLTYELYNSQD